FNKSHAADYGVIAVQTAYLKAAYPAEYMAALLSASAGQTDKVALYAADARSLGVPVLPPDVNCSEWDFNIEDVDGKPAIRFGLGAIKNLGRAATEPVLDERGANGPFKDLTDFARRVDLRALGKRGLECLIKVGALDTFGDRFSLLAAQEQISGASANHFRAKESGQLSLFGSSTGVEDSLRLPAVGHPDKREMLNWERELIGLYVSDHPLTPHQPVLLTIVSHFSGQLGEAQNEEPVRIAGLVQTIRPYVTKAGKPMGFVTLEDIQGNIELVLFPRTWERTKGSLAEDMIVVVEGKVDTSGTPPKVLVDSIRTDLDKVEAEAASGQLLAPGKAAAAKGNGNWKPRPAAATPRPTQPTTPAKSPAQPAGQAASTLKSETAQLPPTDEVLDDGVPPPPENFPADWETEWQPGFEHMAMANQAEPGKIVDVAPEAPPPPTKTAIPTRPPEAPVAAVPINAGPVGDVPAPPAAAEGLRRQLPSLYSPASTEKGGDDRAPKQITVRLRSTGDKERDRRRIKTVYGTLISFHGKDRFSFHIFEDGRGVLMDFPGETTRVCAEMLERLRKVTGEENWSLDEITFL
ncbi:MAG TPA: OB-fold nucleic acid binding domain-containing protein, partial [Anaerolineales bacterium]|nr:OB-fold nucleic acid binding domain-containing protein [Anaerolineales bacterium]